MKRPTKEEIRAAVEKLKGTQPGTGPAPETPVAKQLTEKKSSQRIRKQGV